MRYSITSNFKNLSINWEKWNFEPIVNSAHTAELLTLTKAWINIWTIWCIIQEGNMPNENTSSASSL